MTLAEWVRSTSLGWALGLILLILLVLASEGLGLTNAQTPVGLGIGAGVGLLQSRALRGVIPNIRLWALASATGHLIPFLGFDLAAAAGITLPYSLYLCVALSGVVCGLLQTRLLPPGAAWWLPAAAVGWLLAALTAALADQLPRLLSLRGVPGAVLYLTVALAGGPVLGLITAPVIARLPWRSQA